MRIKNVYNSIKTFFLKNKLFNSYVILSLVGSLLLRLFTIGNIFSLQPLFYELAFILLIGSFSFLMSYKKKFIYLFIWLLIYTIDEFINHIYFLFYTSFASFGELAGLGQAETVTGAIFDKLTIGNFVYILIPICFFIIYKKNNVETTNKKYFFGPFGVGLLILIISLFNTEKVDFERITKQWNRYSIVEHFGIILYQSSDLVKTLIPKFNTLFGYEEAVNEFKEFFENKTYYNDKNKYTDIFKGYNLVFVHMESIQSFLMDLKFNEVEVTPTINKLKKEGMFFENFYPQVNSGTSSDTEFTSLTSLFPISSGIVFTSYYNRNYITIPKLLTDKGYYTFSMHGNYASMWNRDAVHPKLGYQQMYFRDKYDIPSEDSIDYFNLGISDKEFYKQSIPKLEEIEKNNTNYFGYIISLSNHVPFYYLDNYGEFDLSVKVKDENGNVVTSNYLDNTSIGNYIRSAHYADVSLGEFIKDIESSEQFDKTIFVFFGDHDAKLLRNEIDVLYNTNPLTNELYEEDSPLFYDYNNFEHELNKKTPLIIWSKNKNVQKKIHKVVSDVMGMVDLMPTLGNMFDFKNDFSLGNDIFNIKEDNIVVFPNGSFLTNSLYYNNSTSEYYPIKLGTVITDEYIENCLNYVEERLKISDNIIIHDLIYKEKNNIRKEEDIDD